MKRNVKVVQTKMGSLWSTLTKNKCGQESYVVFMHNCLILWQKSLPEAYLAGRPWPPESKNYLYEIQDVRLEEGCVSISLWLRIQAVNVLLFFQSVWKRDFTEIQYEAVIMFWTHICVPWAKDKKEFIKAKMIVVTATAASTNCRE